MENRKASYSYDDIIAHGHGQLFGEKFARLPLPPMLMFDRITTITADGGAHGKGYIEAEFDIKPDLWFFDCHFEGDPVMPGCLGLDAMWQLTGFFMGWLGNEGKGRAIGSGEVKFTEMVLPTAKKITYKIDLKRVITRRLILAQSDGVMTVDGKLAFEANDMKVGLFSD